MNTLVYYLFAIAISLQSVSLTSGFFIYLSDLFILFFMVYAIIFYQKISVNFLSLSVLLLAFYILIANLLNYYLYEGYSFIGFITNYLKIIAIVLMVLFSPSAIKGLDLGKLFKALKIILQIHCLIVIFDHYIVYPWGFDGGLSFSASGEHDKLIGRARGLFEEPSFFALYAGLTFSLLIQYNSLLKSKLLKHYDYIIIFSGLIASSSMTALVVILIILGQMIYTNKSNISTFGMSVRGVLIAIPTILISLPLVALILFGSINYLSERVTDSGNIYRFVGSAMLVAEIAEERPLIGVGLGGQNQRNFTDLLDETLEVDTADSTLDIFYNPSSYWGGLISAGGLPSVLIFYCMILGMIIKSETRSLAILIFAMGVTKGGVFDLYLWLIIVMSISISFFKLEDKKFNVSTEYEKK